MAFSTRTYRMINVYDEDRNQKKLYLSILNIRSDYDDSEVSNIRQRCVDDSLGQAYNFTRSC